MIPKAFLLLATLLLASALPAHSLEFPTTSDRGAPARTQSGGRRDDLCQLDAEKHMKALVPSNNVSTFAGDQASFWLRVPAEVSQKEAEIFVQHPETFEVVYQAQLLLADIHETGFVQVNLPAVDASGNPLLAAGQNYFWEFAIICDASDRSRDHVAQGFVHRVETGAPLAANANASDLQQAEAYAAAGIWQETLAIAAQLRATEPTVWSQLLASVNLASLADEPFIEQPFADHCCYAR